ncbi:MAG: biotin/lipoyl-binding protein, partial [Lachnospiraceae bacterium]|nr:biotin/lipoyl-binding protein [Lachnospiraceae bacterium]
MPERRRTKKRAVMTAVLLAAAVLGVLGFMSFRKSLAEKQRLQAISSVSSAQVTRRSLRTTIIGDGILSGGDAADLKVPKGILVNKVFVESGDMVAEGDLLATLDHNSIREKIAEVQGQIDSVDSSLMSIGEQEEEKIITSPVSGTVTDVFAAPGSSVAAVMENEGSLITLLSDSSLREFQVTGMTGDVLEIYVTKGSRVAQGDDLMKVRTVTDEPRRRQLLADREELSKSLKAYYALSKSDQITAGSDGVIKDVYLTENEVVKEISMTDTSSLAASLTGGNLDLSAYLSMMSAVYPENADGEHKAQRGSETDEFSLRIPSGEGTGDMDGNADMIEDEGFVLLSSDGETGGEAGFEEAFAGGEDAGFEAFEEGGEPVFTEEVSGEKDDGIWYGEGSDTPGSVSSREDSTYAEDIYEAISGTDDAVRDELRAKDGEGYGEEPGQPSYPEQENSPGAVYFDAEYGSTDY